MKSFAAKCSSSALLRCANGSLSCRALRLFGPRVIFGISIPARLLLLTSGAVASAEPKEELQTGHLDGTLTTCLLNLWQSDSTPWAATTAAPGQDKDEGEGICTQCSLWPVTELKLELHSLPPQNTGQKWDLVCTVDYFPLYPERTSAAVRPSCQKSPLHCLVGDAAAASSSTQTCTHVSSEMSESYWEGIQTQHMSRLWLKVADDAGPFHCNLWGALGWPFLQ